MSVKKQLVVRSLILCALLVVNCTMLSALEFLLRPKVFLFFPMGDGNISSSGYKIYDMGMGFDLGFDFDLSSVLPNPLNIGYTVGIEAGMITNPILTADNPRNMVMYSLGGVLGVYYFPISRLFLRIDGAAGVYQGAVERSLTPAGFFWRAGMEAGFRFSPTLLLAANVGWRQ